MPSASKFLGELGAEGRTRTADTMIFSHVLYHLSYLGLPRVEAAGLEPATSTVRL